MGSLEKQVAFITGASRGIGRSTAIAFGKAGALVGVNYRSHPAEADEVVQAIRAAGSDAIAVAGDVADMAVMESMVGQVENAFGPLDIVVANAAYSDREPFHTANMDGFRRCIDVSMWGAFNLLRVAANSMIARGQGGSAVVVSSPHAFTPVAGAMAYNMAKAAMEHMARTAALELSGHRIRVNIIQPGWTDTPGERKYASEEKLKQGGEAIPWGRLGHPDEIARAIVFLTEKESDYITGATLLVDGGICLPWWANNGFAAPRPGAS